MPKIDTTAPRPLPPISLERATMFWAKVGVSSDPDECWPWLGCTEDGYGLVRIGKGRPYKAHRVAFFLKNGFDAIPLNVCHTCDNGVCCNWNHLFRGTDKDNLSDASRKGRMSSGKRNGHSTHPEATPKGEQVNLAKLTEAEVIRIRRMASQGKFPTEIARQFGLHRHTVALIRDRKTWKHI